MSALSPDFILMLTHNDRTIPDACERFNEIRDMGVRIVGFKDVGAPLASLEALVAAIRETGRLVAMEVVSLDHEQEIASAKFGIRLGVDFLMGGTRPEDVLPIVTGTGVRYFPFPGRIEGHPSRLCGGLDFIVSSARTLAQRDDVAGLDLLAYRWQEGEPADLVRAVCQSVVKPVVVAGSVDRFQRVRVISEAGAAAFTVGSAVLDGRFPARSSALRDQVRAVLVQLSAMTTAAAARDASGTSTTGSGLAT